MRRFLLIILMLFAFSSRVYAQELTVPTVPERAEKFMPSNGDNFAEGLLEVLRDVLMYIRPDIREAAAVCFKIIALMMLVSLLSATRGSAPNSVNLASSVGVALILLESSNSLINLAIETITQISEYGKLLLPVMTAALAGQGGVSTSATLYTGTALFDAILTAIIGKILKPMIFLFLFLAIASSAIGDDRLLKLRDTIKWFMTWSLKTILYIYTGYIGITGVVSGSTDAAALKAAKLTISSVVPIVGGILSDASEAVLVGAGTVKNAAGIYGLFAIIALWIEPFMLIGIHYLFLKAAVSVCAVFSSKSSISLIQDFTTAMGLLLAMTGSICLMLLISLVCFFRGVG